MRTLPVLQLILAATIAASPSVQSLAATNQQGTDPPPLVRTPVLVPPPFVVQAASPAKVITSRDRKSALILGQLNKGTAEGFRAAIAASPSIETVVLDSNGGSLGEALDVAEMVRDRRLKTLVERSCISACTLILLAGEDRAAAPNARIGFHKPVFPNASPEDLPTLMSIARSFYDDAGVSPTFTDRTFRTPHSTVWYPSTTDLVSAGVLTRISLGGETTALSTVLSSKNDLVKALQRISYWGALVRKHPDIASEFIDVSWKAKQAGASDNDLTAAGRAVMTKYLPTMLRAAPDNILIDFLDLVVDQLEAARAVSFEACERASTGKLNVISVLPRSLLERELAIMTRALEAESVTKDPDEKLALQILEPMYSGLPADQLGAVAGEPGYESVSAKCNGMLSLYRQIRGLDFRSKAIVARYFFTTE